MGMNPTLPALDVKYRLAAPGATLDPEPAPAELHATAADAWRVAASRALAGIDLTTPAQDAMEAAQCAQAMLRTTGFPGVVDGWTVHPWAVTLPTQVKTAETYPSALALHSVGWEDSLVLAAPPGDGWHGTYIETAQHMLADMLSDGAPIRVAYGLADAFVQVGILVAVENWTMFLADGARAILSETAFILAGA